MDDAVLGRFAEVLGDREWRLNHLYWVESKMVKGGDKVVRFRMNRVQRKLHRGLHHRNAILKSRQMGISTYLAMLALDCMLFVDGFHAGIVDKSLPDAENKLGKIRFAWDRLDYVPAHATDEDLWLARLGRMIKERTGKLVKSKGLVPVYANDRELRFANGSDIYSGASLRGGTLDLLWLTEFGSTACHFQPRRRKYCPGRLIRCRATGFCLTSQRMKGAEPG